MNEFFSDKEASDLKGRIGLPKYLVIFAFLILTVALWYLQVTAHPFYSELSQSNRLRLINTTAPRGLILDRNGAILAENRPGFDLLIVPEDVNDWEETTKKLSMLVNMDSDLIIEKLKKAKGRPPFVAVKLKDDLSWEEMVRVEAAKFRLPGVRLAVGPKRVYPPGRDLAHLVGYLGEISEKELRRYKDEGITSYKVGDMTGKYGVEKSFEHMLQGKDGGRHVEVDALGREIRLLKDYPPYPGNNLQVTIDLALQNTAAIAMDGKAGAVVAMDPQTGEILAFLSAPAFDPNALTAGVSVKEWKAIINNPLNILTNRAISGQYPPASTFKLITAATALETGVITPYKKILSGPSFTFVDREYRDWKKEGHGEINIRRAIIESSDTFFYQVGLELGIDNIAEYATGFGLGERTGIKLGGERKGLIPTTKWKKRTYGEKWYRGETIASSVGQGFILATPLQMLKAFSAIANGGTLLKPKLLKEITTPEGVALEKFYPETVGTLPLSPGTLRLLQKALRGVVSEKGGTARGLLAGGFKIAGKTGTAQVATSTERVEDIETVKYKLRDHAWFVGYAPYDAPEIAIAVLVEHGGFGSRAAAPVALKLFRDHFERKEALRLKEEATREEATALPDEETI